MTDYRIIIGNNVYNTRATTLSAEELKLLSSLLRIEERRVSSDPETEAPELERLSEMAKFFDMAQH